METIVKADDRGRIILKGAVKGDRFRITDNGERKVIEKLDTDPSLVKPVRRGGKLMLPKPWTRRDVRAAIREGRERSF